MLFYHATHRILYDEAGWRRACGKVAGGDGSREVVIAKEDEVWGEIS
jgi:hypothetical protein